MRRVGAGLGQEIAVRGLVPEADACPQTCGTASRIPLRVRNPDLDLPPLAREAHLRRLALDLLAGAGAVQVGHELRALGVDGQEQGRGGAHVRPEREVAQLALATADAYRERDPRGVLERVQ